MNHLDTATAVAFVLFALCGGHAVADYGLQSAYVAEYKVAPKRGVTNDDAARDGKLPNRDWFVTLLAHCLIHGFLVLAVAIPCSFAIGLIDGAGWRSALIVAIHLGTALGCFETAMHFGIDDAKGQGRFSYRVDQALHYGCKALWTAMIIMLVA